MKALGIVLVWLGVICVLFSIHWLIGSGAIALSLSKAWEYKKERDFVRRALAPGAGMGRKE